MIKKASYNVFLGFYLSLFAMLAQQYDWPVGMPLLLHIICARLYGGN